MNYQLAQINVGRLRYPAEDARLAEFMNNLELVNGIAESTPGFVWRLKDDSGNATHIHAYEDPQIIVNMSVWGSVEALQLFAYRVEHVQFFRRRAEWFEDFGGPSMALWWIESGHFPSAAQGREKVEYLTKHGITQEAFTFREKFSAPDYALTQIP